MKTLKAINLVKRYGQRPVVNHLSLEVRAGEVVGLLGPNGAGKTTVFSIIMGLLQSDGGEIWLDGDELTGYPAYLRARKGLSFLPQETSVFRGLSAEDNLRLVIQLLPEVVSQKDEQAIAGRLLEEFGLKAVASVRADRLSGGEKRRLEIARAMVRQPAFILLDEPFSELDPLAVSDLQSVIKRLKEKRVGVLLTDHRLSEALKILDRIYIIYDGRIIAEGRPEEVLSKVEVKEIYLGSDFRL